MANRLSKEKQLAVLRCLVEGNSIRSTERITGVHRDTVMRFLVKFGNDCHEWLNLTLSNLVLAHIEADEIWTFVGRKEKKLTGREKQTGELGSQFLYVGIDQSTKLIAALTEATTRAFVDDPASRMWRGHGRRPAPADQHRRIPVLPAQHRQGVRRDFSVEC